MWPGSLNVAPSDGVLLLAAIVTMTSFRLRLRAWSFWHPGICLAFAVSTLVAATNIGSLNRYIYLNKDLGLLVLCLGYAMITSAAQTWDDIRRLLEVLRLERCAAKRRRSWLHSSTRPQQVSTCRGPFTAANASRDF
jgi:hypothetical protein